MLDLGLTKLAVIGVVALVVVGPERLPRVARTMGALFGRAQRYVSEVKAEVTRELELEELKQIRSSFKQAAQDIEGAMNEKEHLSSVQLDKAGMPQTSNHPPPAWTLGTPLKKSWRAKRSGLPLWYKQVAVKRVYVQSGAARVARHRATSPRQPTRFF